MEKSERIEQIERRELTDDELDIAVGGVVKNFENERCPQCGGRFFLFKQTGFLFFGKNICRCVNCGYQKTFGK